MDNSRIKVLLTDDHPLVLEGIKAVLETYPHIEIVGSASSVKQALKIADQSLPDVVMMDINMDGTNGLEAIELFKEQHPKSRLLMLSMHDNKEYISTSVMHGAFGYVLKDVSTNEIVTAIETVAAGNTYFSPRVSDVLLNQKKAKNPKIPITTREQSVLLLVAEGKSSKNVAIILGISTRTVETHRKNIKQKLDIKTTAELTRFALENGLIRD